MGEFECDVTPVKLNFGVTIAPFKYANIEYLRFTIKQLIDLTILKRGMHSHKRAD